MWATHETSNPAAAPSVVIPIARLLPSTCAVRRRHLATYAVIGTGLASGSAFRLIVRGSSMILGTATAAIPVRRLRRCRARLVAASPSPGTRGTTRDTHGRDRGPDR